MDDVLNALFAFEKRENLTRSVPRGVLHFPRWFWYSITLFILSVVACRLLSVVSVLFRRRLRKYVPVPNSETLSAVDETGSDIGRGRYSVLQRIFYATFSYLKNIAFRKTVRVPIAGCFNVSEIVLTAVYLFLTLLWTHLEVQAQHPSSFYKFSLIWSDRAGIIASSQIPLMIALAGKNNIISYLTGITYEKLNILHQATSHVMFIMVYIHSIPWVGVWLLNIRPVDWSIFWLWTGVVATVAHTLITILGLKAIRRLSYEVFLITHIILAFVFLLFTYFHVSYHVFGLGFTVWPALLLWASDHIVRTLRIILLIFVSRAGGCSNLNANIKVMPGETLLVEVSIPPSKHLSWVAGQSAYITVPRVSAPLPEAHPFTIASIDIVTNKAHGVDNAANRDDDNEDSQIIHDFNQDGKRIKFIVRACEGFTRKLYDFAVKKISEEGECFVPMYIDGPYSHPPPVEDYETSIFIAGGSGVAFTLPLLLSIVRERTHELPACKRIIFIWTIKHYEHISWIKSDLEELSNSNQSNIDIEIRIYVTQSYRQVATASRMEDIESSTLPPNDFTSDDEELEAKLQNKWPTLPTSIVLGRPELDSLLSDEITSSQSKNIAVVVCGPDALTESVRQALRNPESTGFRAVMNGAPSVYLHVESFSW